MAFDWIDEFMDYTDGVTSPYEFRLWSGLLVLAAVLERKCWTENNNGRLYPNLYVMLGAPPATGKGVAIQEARRMLSYLAGANEIYLGPDNPTAASLMDEIEKAQKSGIPGMELMIYSAMTVLAREFTSFMGKNDIVLAANLSDIYDNPETFNAPRRTGNSSVNLQAPTLNMIMAVTPDTLQESMPETAWGQGWTSRIIFIYGVPPKKYIDPFKKRKEADASRLTKPLKKYFDEIRGPFEWDPDAADAMRFWLNEGEQKPIPDYGRLKYYNGRRQGHLMKLSMLSSVSSSNAPTVALSDFERAQRWLFDAEKKMPDFFKSMGQKNDSQLLSDMHHWMYITFGQFKQEQKKRGMHEQDMVKYLEEKVPHEKVESLIKMMERTGRIMRNGVAGYWLPHAIKDKQFDS